MKLIDILSEIVTREKKALGKGAQHKIYPHPTNPDVVYKVGQYHVMIGFRSLKNILIYFPKYMGISRVM